MFDALFIPVAAVSLLEEFDRTLRRQPARRKATVCPKRDHRGDLPIFSPASNFRSSVFAFIYRHLFIP
jgi:hypothetical protein